MDKNLQLTDEHYRYLRQMRSNARDPLLAELRRETEALGEHATMIAAEEQGDFFTILVGAMRVDRALEIGTFTGFSSLCIARGLAPGGRLLCCDVNAEWTAIARRYWERAGVSDRIELRLGPAAATLGKLEAGWTFDFVFIDADKLGYDAYYELVLPRVVPGGLIVFDNMLSHGTLLRPSTPREHALDALNRKLAVDPRVDSVLVPIADGLMLCKKK